MAGQPLSDEVLRRALRSVETHGSTYKAASALGMPRETLRSQVKRARERGLTPEDPGRDFEIDPDLPDERPSTEELLARREKDFERKYIAKHARKLIDVKIKLNGPIGIAHFGDPHVDDDGCNIKLLRQHLNTIKRTPGLLGANLGDMHNNWIGRLARLYGQQSTSAADAWQLVEWMIKEIPWLYLVGGNHDCWSGDGDPLMWIARQQSVLHQAWGVRLNLKFPNGKEVRTNARHDFEGHSMWNPAHGPMKAVQGGWRDHILTCGHKHTSFVAGPLKCPATGILSWAIRAAGYKVVDRYAEEKGLPDQNAFSTAVTIIDPQYGDDDTRLVTVIPDVDEGAEFLTWKRNRK